MSVRLEQVGHHALAFHAEDLPDGFADCVVSGKRMDVNTWLVERCPGKRKKA